MKDVHMSHFCYGHLKRVHCLIASMMLASTFAMASGGIWMTDYDAALVKAKEEKKDLLINFSGSDWCGWCIKLDKQVFNEEAFQAQAGKTFILVVLDFPNKPENKAKIPEKLQARNRELQKQFEIRGFPSVLLVNSDGEAYARTGYQAGGVEPYLEHLSSLRNEKVVRAEIEAKLDASEGVERAKLLDQLIQATQANLRATMVGQMNEIIKLDPDNDAGLKNKYELQTRLLDATSYKLAMDFDAAETLYSEIIADLKPEGQSLQQVYMEWGEVKFRLNEKTAILEYLQKALDAAPESEFAPQLKGMIERFTPAPKAPAETETPTAP
ncbi:MAG: thioredoxin-related protein [Candidatus Promineifilaceae bacterium]|jgi:thioredoxin-related protein